MSGNDEKKNILDGIRTPADVRARDEAELDRLASERSS